ncbi:MAG: MAPEG family protein [Rhizobiales bacterium]|nr:MAPEG family protein [Hyphomicrobiales bacterium]
MFDAIPQLGFYQPSLLALALLCMAVLVQSFLTAPLAFVSNEQVPGMPLKGDHTLRSFRVLRAYQNSVESLPTFGLAIILAIILGVNAELVNWLAAIHVVARLAFWIVYYSGVGSVAGGLRTLCYVGGMLSNLVLLGASVYVLAV